MLKELYIFYYKGSEGDERFRAPRMINPPLDFANTTEIPLNGVHLSGMNTRQNNASTCCWEGYVFAEFAFDIIWKKLLNIR